MSNRKHLVTKEHQKLHSNTEQQARVRQQKENPISVKTPGRRPKTSIERELEIEEYIQAKLWPDLLRYNESLDTL